MPVIRKAEPESEFISCRVTLIKWVINYMHISKKNSDGAPSSISSSSHSHYTSHHSHEEDPHNDSTHPSLDSGN